MSNAQQSLDTIEDFVQNVGPAKTAEANTEAGGFEGPTTHAVKDVEDGTENADEGARSAENTEDIKDPDIGPGAPSVDNTADATAKVGSSEGSAAEDHQEATTNVQATGDDPANETSGTKNTKDDEGYEGASSHPARTDNGEIDGHKYARDLQSMPLEKLAAHVGDLGNQICADLATEATTAKQAMSDDDSCSGCNKPKNMCKCGMYAGDKTAGDDLTPALAKQVGWEMAGLVTGNFDKQAANKLVEESLTDIVKTAADDGDNVVTYLNNYFHAQNQAAEKAAYDKRAMAAMGGQPGGDPGGLPPEAMAAMGGGAPGGAPGGEEDPMAALAGGGAPGGEEDPLAALAGGGGGELGAEGGEGQIDPAQLAQVLDALGISMEELIEATGQQGGGMGGAEMAGAPGAEMGGAPGGAELPPEAGGMEAAASAATTPEEKKAHLTNYVREVVSRSRQKKAEALSKAASDLSGK